jgi:putative heme iron utilization protein
MSSGMAQGVPDHGLTARQLMRAVSSATLATAGEGGQPFAALVTPAIAADGAILLLLSALSEHTRQLGRDPRCALLFQGMAEGPNPQTTPRISVTGLAVRVEDAALKARWLVHHPYAAFYADFTDFGLWRMAPGGGLLVLGFGSAHRLRAAQLAPDPTAVAALAAAEAEIVGQMNTDHADALAAIATARGGRPGAWRMANLSPDGCDLIRDEAEEVGFLPFPAPVGSPNDARAALVTAARQARAGRGATTLPK